MNYNEAQLEIINTIDGNIGVIASAGSGKTTVLTKRIENMVKNHSIAPQDILAVTFSKKAKENIQNKLKELNVNGVNIETFHSLALKIIGTRYGVGYFKVWTLQWEKEKVIQTICYNRMNLCSKEDVPYNDILRFIGKQKNAMLSIKDVLIYSDDDPFSKNNMKEIFVNYERFKEENKYIEFDDFLNLANEALDEDENTYNYYSKPNRWLDKKFLQEVENNSKKKNTSFYNSMMSIDRRNWRFKNGIDEIYEVINYLQNKRFSSIGDMISYLRSRLDIDNYVTKGKEADDGSFSEQIENMNAFETIAKKYTDLNKFILYLDEITKDLEIDNKNKVHLLTIHKSKGLEYPVVFIIGCSDKILPHEKNENIDDEKKLFYVGITRAEKELYLSSILSNNCNSLNISPFIDAIKPTIKIN